MSASDAGAATADPAAEVADFRARLKRLEDELGRVVVGQGDVVRQTLVAILAGGHVLLEGVPGLGKTVLCRSFSQALDMKFKRIQFTPDLMPADILGTLVVTEDEQGRKGFRFQEGPIFGNLVLADEVNRATPKTQSALLQAMEERAVTLDRETRPLPRPFLVIATQNPAEQIGTFDLPESQLDRFSLSMDIGRPDHTVQAEILSGARERTASPVAGVMVVEELLAIQDLVRGLAVAPEVIDYALRLSDMMEAGALVNLSVRFRTQLLRLAQAHAVIAGRDFIAPDDLQAMMYPALRHRLTRVEPGARADLVGAAMADTPLP